MCLHLTRVWMAHKHDSDCLWDEVQKFCASVFFVFQNLVSSSFLLINYTTSQCSLNLAAFVSMFIFLLAVLGTWYDCTRFWIWALLVYWFVCLFVYEQGVWCAVSRSCFYWPEDQRESLVHGRGPWFFRCTGHTAPRRSGWSAGVFVACSSGYYVWELEDIIDKCILLTSIVLCLVSFVIQ